MQGLVIVSRLGRILARLYFSCYQLSASSNQIPGTTKLLRLHLSDQGVTALFIFFCGISGSGNH
jgi:hypothetical protein